MPGTYLTLLDADFAYALADSGSAITISHVSSQAIVLSTGALTTVAEQQAIEAVVEHVSRKELLLNPAKYLESDRVFHFRSTGLSVAVEVGDTITYSSTAYKLYEVAVTEQVYRCLGRKAT